MDELMDGSVDVSFLFLFFAAFFLLLTLWGGGDGAVA